MEKFEVQTELPASPEDVYTAWLNSEFHSEFTGGLAAIQDEIDSRFTAWDGYITGRILELEKGKSIIQSWRTTEFSEADDDSMVEIQLESSPEGCLLKLKHWNIPDGQGANYEQGWFDHYFVPMKEFFSNR